MATITTIQETECIGSSLKTINTNFSNLNQEITDDTTRINTLSSFVSNIGTTVSLSSNFVYSIYADNGGRVSAAMTNTWQDVFVDSSRTPLRISYNNNTSNTYTVLLQGKVYARNYTMAATSFFRLAQFSSTTNAVVGTADAPIAVIDTAACEGNVSYSHAYNTVLQSVFTIQPNTTYVFGLQTWVPSSGAGSNGGLQINGWQTNSKDAWPTNYNPSSYTASYANASVMGYTDSSNSIGVYSYLKLIVI
jgi:archaellum component FlaG (FlaF/FlaG flagellin family)